MNDQNISMRFLCLFFVYFLNLTLSLKYETIIVTGKTDSVRLFNVVWSHQWSNMDPVRLCTSQEGTSPQRSPSLYSIFIYQLLHLHCHTHCPPGKVPNWEKMFSQMKEVSVFHSHEWPWVVWWLTTSKNLSKYYSYTQWILIICSVF